MGCSRGIYEKVIEVEILENIYPVNVYNLTVEDNQNYFVGKDEVLTHNITTKKNCQKFREYLKSIIGDPPKDMIDPHAHHILFKKGNGKAQQELVKEGQEILKKHGIDPIWGKENLVWAPNRIKGQHNIDSLREIVEALIEVDEFGGEYDEIVKVLEKFGRKAAKKGI